MKQFVLVSVLGFDDFRCRSTHVEHRGVYTSNDGSQSGVIVDITQPSCDLDEHVCETRSGLRLVMTEDERHYPGI